MPFVRIELNMQIICKFLIYMVFACKLSGMYSRQVTFGLKIPTMWGKCQKTSGGGGYF